MTNYANNFSQFQSSIIKLNASSRIDIIRKGFESKQVLATSDYFDLDKQSIDLVMAEFNADKHLRTAQKLLAAWARAPRQRRDQTSGQHPGADAARGSPG